MYYKSLFNINIHHGYFLDKGEVKFLPIDIDNDEKMEDDDKEASLKEYNFLEYLSVVPTQSTEQIFKNYKGVLRKHAKGFRVLVNTLKKQTKHEPIIPFEKDITFTFQLKSTDPYFHNYTTLSDASENRMYLFTNVVPNNQEAVFKNVFDDKGGPIDNRYLLNEEATRDLIRTITVEDESFTTVDDPLTISNSIQYIEKNETLTEDEKETEIANLLNEVIQRKKKQRVIGYVRLTIKGDGEDGKKDLLNLVEDEQSIKGTTLESTISFINRKTLWRFVSSSDDVTLTTKDEKWLSKNGFTEIIGKSTDENPSDFDPEPVKDYKFPNPTVEIIKKVNNEDNQYYSEIFI